MRSSHHPSGPIPTRIINKLLITPPPAAHDRKNAPPVLPTATAGPSPQERTVDKLAVYRLACTDLKEQRYYQLKPFVSPQTGINQRAVFTHHLWIDLQLLADKPLVYVIEGCQETKTPLYIYALFTMRGKMCARQIAYWAVDHTHPRLDLKANYECIVLVPGTDETQAGQLVVAENDCTLLSARKAV